MLIENKVNIKSSPTFKSWAKDVYLYGKDNFYPNMYKHHVRNSGTAKACTDTYAEFLRGEGFENEAYNELEINRNGLTFFKLLEFIAKEKSLINFAVHLAYNRFGQITDITPVNYELIRKNIRTKEDKWDKYSVRQNWGNNYNYSFTDDNLVKEYFAFNPSEVKKQIKEVGFDNYMGQILYISDTDNSSDVYQYGFADVSLKSMQFENEAEIYSLSNIQNGFPISGALSYAANMKDTEGNKSFVENLKKDGKGAFNAGRIIAIPKPPNVDKGIEFESFTLNNVDTLFTNQLAEAEKKIKIQYNQQDALLGISPDGFLASEDLSDAYKSYNKFTKNGRIEIENVLNMLFSYSIYNVSNVKIKENTFE
jgi:hypothetical protein